MNLLEVEGLRAGYTEEVDILNGVSVQVGEGEIVAIIGPNGAGKSTLLKAIFGLLRPREGKVTFSGEDITGAAPEVIVRKGMSYVPQVQNVFTSLTVQENLEMGAFVREDDFSDRLEALYRMFPDLERKKGERVGRLSGGQRQMVALARALMLDPKLLLLDEPSAGLSPAMVSVVFEKIREIKGAGVAILIVEQNAKEALRLSDRAYVLAMGRNVLSGPGEELLENEEVGRLYLGGG
ncbi:MAG: ABC transporter ATP-binding protein [Deltaproteobacteria bacterium]|nr:MAG: ABC transporter ATP-binding protein [Deltaproteobacteria bacterium]